MTTEALSIFPEMAGIDIKKRALAVVTEGLITEMALWDLSLRGKFDEAPPDQLAHRGLDYISVDITDETLTDVT